MRQDCSSECGGGEVVALCEGTCTQLKAVGVGHVEEDGGLLEVEVYEGGGRG